MISDIINPETLVIVENEDIEYLILAPDEFSGLAEDLKTLHSENVQENDQLKTEVVLISEILMELNTSNLSGQDIKSFVEMKLEQFIGLKYLLIFGDETHFPPIYSNSTPSDDYYSSLNGSIPFKCLGNPSDGLLV